MFNLLAASIEAHGEKALPRRLEAALAAQRRAAAAAAQVRRRSVGVH